MMTNTAQPWTLTDFQEGIPGPRKLRMTEADSSGAANADVQFLADRLAILNHLTAYAYLIDERRWDAWFALFSDDIVFECTVPGFGTIHAEGKATLRAITELRYGPTTAMRRHTMGNVHVASQSDTSAEARAYLLTSTVPAADRLEMLTSGVFNASLRKIDGCWRITRWYIEIDAPLAHSPVPQEALGVTLRFEPA